MALQNFRQSSILTWVPMTCLLPPRSSSSIFVKWLLRQWGLLMSPAGIQHLCPQTLSICGRRGLRIQRVWATGQATGRNPEGQRDLPWLGDGIICWGHIVTGSFNGNQTVAKALDVQQSGDWTPSVYGAECQCPEQWKFHSWILLLNRVVSGGKEGRWIRASRAMSCFPLLVTPGATQLYLHAAARKCSARKTAACVPLLTWSHLTHQESTLKNKNEKGLLLPLI